MWQRRLLCTATGPVAKKPSFHPTLPRQNRSLKSNKWAVKQVNKSSFPEALEEIKSHIAKSDFVAVSLQKTGGFSSPWHKALPFDTADLAYCKAKYAAERFQVFQFAVSPFSVKSSTLVAHPYNFHLFPRDELKTGMPSYSFLCQSSYLTAMAQEGFDFNACINDGISYLSKAQESAVKGLNEIQTPPSTVTSSVADLIFIERIKSRVRNWISTLQDSEKKAEDALISSLRKIISGTEMFGSRSSLTIDICSDRQVQLVMEVLKDFTNVVPIFVPAKGGSTYAIRAVLATSKEDKENFEKELRLKEEEKDKQARGFREVIDLISTSQKPVVVHNSINELTFIHSKFLAPLPSRIDEFRSSLSSVFSHIFDVSHLMREVGSQKKLNNLSSAIMQLKKRVTVPLNMEIPQDLGEDEGGVQGHDVLRISEIFAKLCLATTTKAADNCSIAAPMSQVNMFFPSQLSKTLNEDVGISTNNTRRISINNLAFLWGFELGMVSARKLRSLLIGMHEVFSGEFDVRMADSSCAIVVFSTPGLAERFLEVMNSKPENSGSLEDLISEGVRAAGYAVYKRVCQQGIWEENLADALDKCLAEDIDHSEASSEEELLHMDWNNDDMISLDDL